MLRIGLVGAGPWARQTHAPALAAHPGVDFVGGWARNPAAAAEVFPRSFDSPAALFDAVDAVAFAVPPDVQAPLAVNAAAAGRHLILDKPVALDLPAAEAVAAAVATAGVRSIVTFTRRFAPETRRFLAEAAAVAPVAGEAQWLSGAILGGQYAASAWRQTEGALYDVGPHIFDLLDAALGPVREVLSAHRHAESDTWTIALAHVDERVSTVSLSLRTPATPTVMRVVVHSGAGVAILDDRGTPSPDCYATLLDEFLACVADGSDHRLDVHRGVAMQRIVSDVAAALG